MYKHINISIPYPRQFQSQPRPQGFSPPITPREKPCMGTRLSQSYNSLVPRPSSHNHQEDLGTSSRLSQTKLFEHCRTYLCSQYLGVSPLRPGGVSNTKPNLAICLEISDHSRTEFNQRSHTHCMARDVQNLCQSLVDSWIRHL